MCQKVVVDDNPKGGYMLIRGIKLKKSMMQTVFPCGQSYNS